MAAEIPVKDVLCEAMEYLSKLGSNLRTRSENLKEKRIRRDKLTNALAVQKAADKVLLICELSKKSLANVEAGVRKIMEQIDVSQASRLGGKSSSSKTESKKRHDKPNYHYFDYKSRKLKIKNKISLKHYKSVKVLATKMSSSMLNKYPVYLDCKLYRMRRKKEQSKKEDSLKQELVSVREEETTEKDESIIMDQPPSAELENNSETNENQRRSSEKSHRRNSKSDKKKKYVITSDDDENDGKKSTGVASISDNEKHQKATKQKDQKTGMHKNDDGSDNISDNEMHQKGSKQKDPKKSKDDDDVGSDNEKHQKGTKQKDLKKRRDDHDDDNSSDNEKHQKDTKEKDRKKGRDNNDDGSDNEIHQKETQQNNQRKGKDNDSSSNSEKPLKDTKHNDQNKGRDDDNSSDNEKNQKDTKTNDRKKGRNNHSSSDNEDTSTKHDDNESNQSCTEPEPKKRKLNKTVNKHLNENNSDVVSIDSDIENNPSNSKIGKDGTDGVSNKTTEQNDTESDTEENANKGNNSDGSTKPIIKCVSLSKLLKPAVLQKDPIKKYVPKKFKRLEFDVDKKNEMLQSAKKKKDKFWAQKRKEVCAFKPKKFSINITRLPELNTKFLLEHNLKKITKKGQMISEILKEKSDSTLPINSNKNAQVNDDALKAETDKIKSSLLNESDSDNNEKESEANVDRIKSALLYSDSDQSDIIPNTKEPNNTKEKEKEGSDNKEERFSVISDKLENSKSDQRKADSDRKRSKNNLEKSDSGNKSDKSDKSCNNERENKINSGTENDSVRDHKTPEKEKLPANNDECDNEAKISLLKDSDHETDTPLDQRKAATPQSKKKRLRESVHAKNALLRHSSGSETEDEELRNVLNNIKKTLLENISDDENILKVKNPKSSQESSSSGEDILEKVKKKKKKKKKSTQLSSQSDSDTTVQKKKLNKHKKRGIKSDSEEKNNGSSNDEDKPTSSRSKMVRSKAKPGNSSSHSSDAQDSNDKDIDGLANLRTLKSSRRRISDTDKDSSSNSAATRTRMSGKPTGLISEEILKAESSSDAASAEEDEAVDDDLPSVKMPGFNGGLEHLVKEDLLRESDSSVSNKEETKDDSDEEERLNAKRRKANAIASSDSETGTARQKDKDDDDVRLSGFEDSDDSDIAKKTKRKKKGSDSDASTESTDAGKKKRRRIKSVNDSDVSGSDSENEGKNKHGRKNIRRVMGKNQLEEATKKAAREEKERVARIAERQKMYNNLQFDESGKPDEVVLEKVVLDFDPETKEPLIAVDRGLVKKLKPHQANGIKFMWDACFESAKRIKKDKGSGCILAHCMGLGKTLQVVALTHTLLAHNSLTKVNRVLVVCPLSTVLNWVNEFKMWLKHAERESDIDVYELSRYKQNGERAFQLSQWFEHGGVCVLGYEMFRNLSADNNKKFKKKMLKNFQEALVEPGPDLVVCDEGHLLKNEKTSLSQSMNKVRTLRRIVLTGTPLQNNLKEYYCMVQFVKPNLLGKYNEYLNRFVNPITNGQYTDSTEHDIKIMKRRSHVLHKMLDGAVQRRDYGVLAPFLPPKHEYVLFITLTEVQTKLYQFYLDNYSRRPLPGKSSGFLFPDFQSLQRIWTHPLVLKYNSERYEILQQKKRDKEEEDSEGSLVDFIDDDSTPAESSSEDSSDDSSDMSDDSRKKSKKKKSSKKGKGKDKDKDKDKDSTAGGSRRRTRANPIELDLEDDKEDDIMEVKNENPTEWWIKLVEEDVLDDLRNSHKLVLLFDILRQCETIGDKLLVFSQSLYSLDLIEHFLGKVDEATQEGRIDEKLGRHVGSWSPGVDYFRLDGSTSCENRSIWCKNFNREDNPRARLFLISTRAGGLGINLVAANRVVIFDVSWNPSHDVQSIFRVYRFGQKKPCYVYRFLAMGTMEEKIYERQVTKQAISKRVIDEQQIDRHYAENDLAELYKFEAEPPSPRPIPPLPKDRLFAEMLREHEAQIYKYHEHDSLLENKEEETLSEEERKAAWEDFENEKNRPPPAPFPSPWPMANGMMPNLLAQQQQQLAYAALAAMLRKDMPNVNDNQIRDMLPMIYSANPALMQKMTDIYKYSQQMNMTPGMMGQGGMNSASSGGGLAGMGGASGLQYEPPWQRQQQQQQQMRLQQLMAQQQNMGAAAKFYAGGLGSRDPVAMALQQQRAREIMVGGGAGRPRGRPPLQPREPPPPSADVVNLDSD